jgi:5'-nucleotidase/UDP-sugar diphosphatase
VAPYSKDMQTIKLLFTSDEHGHIKKASRIQNLIKKEKTENPNTFLVSSGDIFQGTPESDLLGGKPSLDVVREAGYDLVELGNHDFDNGVGFVKNWLKSAEYPVLAGNVVEESTGKRLPGAKSYEVFDVGGMKMGLIGVVTPGTKTSARADDVEGLKFLEPAPVVRQAKKELEEQGVEFIGVVSHLGLGDDKKLAAEVDGLDFILGGHTHQVLETPEQVGDTLICQPGCFRDYLGSLEMKVDEKTGNVVSFEHHLIPTQEGQEEASTVADVVRAATEKLDSANSTVISKTDAPLVHHHSREHTLGYETAEAMRAVTDTPVALFNLKVQRADISEGAVTAGELYKALPFPNNVVKARVRRDDLEKAIILSEERDDYTSLSRHWMAIDFAPDKDGKLEVAGIDLTLDPNPGSEFVEVATTDYIAKGGLGYFQNAEIISEHGLMREVLEKHLDSKASDDKLKSPELSVKNVFASLLE